tara:strand:- start:779 stop:1090 length:312 start_codon:yes stop_codon:yes gene_type:complete
LGWALAGACSGPIFTLLGAGFSPILVVLLAAIVGALLQGVLKINYLIKICCNLFLKSSSLKIGLLSIDRCLNSTVIIVLPIFFFFIFTNGFISPRKLSKHTTF